MDFFDEPTVSIPFESMAELMFSEPVQPGPVPRHDGPSTTAVTAEFPAIQDEEATT